MEPPAEDPVSDTTPPTVAETAPGAGATDVSRSPTLSVTFDEPIFAPSLEDSITLHEVGGEAIAGLVGIGDQAHVATFEPATALKILTAYEATVLADVTDLAGNAMAAEYRWSFTTRDGVWGEAEEQGAGLAAQIAVDAVGNAVVVWQDVSNNLWANRYEADGGWQTPALIENEAAAAVEARVGMDAAGNAIAVWRQNNDIWANRYSPGAGWQGAELIEQAAGAAATPQIAVDAAGNAVAVWAQSDGTRYNVWANRYVAGTGWQTPESVETNLANAVEPQVAVSADGGAVAVWRQSDGVVDSIWANRYVVGDGWQVAELLETEDGVAYEPHVVMDAAGNAVAVWKQEEGGGFEVWANRYTLGTGWQGAELLSDASGNVMYPQVAMDAAGDALAVWPQDGRIRVTRYVAGDGWDEPLAIDLADAGWSDAPKVAFDATGNALAVWQQNDEIWANRYVAGSGWQTPGLLGSSDTAYAPHVATGGNGEAVAVWHQFAPGLAVWAARFH